MSIAPTFSRRAWVLLPVLAVAFIALNAFLRIQRVRYVSSVADWSLADAAGAAAKQPAFLGALPRMIIPGDNTDSIEWMDQTRQMLSTGELRVRHIDYENAPFGHSVRSASPYRWWLGLIAWVCHALSGRPLGPSLETAALVADPLLQVLLLLGAAYFVARRFGLRAAALLCAGMATLYPFAVGFLPGAPDDQGLALAAGLGSLLPLLAGVADGARRRRWFLGAGIVGGLALWISVSTEVPLLMGVVLGGLFAAWTATWEARANAGPDPEPFPWRAWALGGAAASLGAYGIEYFPSNLGSWELRSVHPIYGLAWLGAGEALALACAWIQKGKSAWTPRAWAGAALAALAIASLPVALHVTQSTGFLTIDLPTLRLTRLPSGVASSSLASWIYQDGFSATVWATLLPLALVGPALWLLFRSRIGFVPKATLALALGPVLLALGFACRQLSWWNGLDVALLILLVAVCGVMTGPWELPRHSRVAWLSLLALVLACGAFESVSRTGFSGQKSLEESEVVSLIERDLSRWLASHSPAEAIVLAPTRATTALYYYGGLRGLATADWENKDGVQAAVRIVSATTSGEALALIEHRGVTHLIIPSWDSQLDSFARLGLGQVENSFIDLVHHWALIPWMRPVAYPIPVINGFEGQSVVIMEVVEEQTEAVMMSRMTEYFVETGNLDLAASAERALRRFPTDVGALVARAQVLLARGETEAFRQSVEAVLPRLSGEGARALPWDLRVNLAVVLAQGRHMDRARSEVQSCMTGMDEAQLRSLATGSLYHLQVLAKLLGVDFPNPKLHQLALSLLPADLRTRLHP